MRKLWQHDSAGMLQGCTGQNYFAWQMIDGTQLIRRTRENHGTCWHTIVAYVLTGCLPCPPFLACLCLHLTDLQSISGHSTDHITMYCIVVFHCQPNTIFQQLDLIRNNTKDVLVQCMRPSIVPQKQYLFLCIFPCYFSQIPILIPLNSKQLNERQMKQAYPLGKKSENRENLGD